MHGQKDSNRQLLKLLERSGKFLFHGSPRKLAKIEPRQQMNFDYRIGKLMKDGRPAVCATPYIDVAIFRALVNKGWTSFGTVGRGPFFGASRQALSAAKNKTGFVYVFSKKDFHKHSPIEYRSLKRQVPLAVVPVAASDLAAIKKKILRRNEYLKKIG